MARSRIVLLVVAAATVAGLGHEAAAQDRLPSGKIGLSIGVRQGTGALRDDFGVGGIFAIEAHFHPTNLERPWSVGIGWSVLRGWFGPEDIASISGSLNLLEFNAALRVRRRVGRAPRFLVFSAGGTLLRTNVPIGDEQTRVHVGPYFSLGGEMYTGGGYLLSLEIRGGMIGVGPGSLSALLGFHFGA